MYWKFAMQIHCFLKYKCVKNIYDYYLNVIHNA